MKALDKLARLYRKIGVHSAPRGTLFHSVNAFVHSIVHRRARAYATVTAVSRGAFGGIPYYDISSLRRARPINGIALIFFIGAGDYLMATPLIKRLYEEHPDLPLWAFVSANTDSVNSSLVMGLLNVNPLIHKVATYNGKPRHVWTEYDFTDALGAIPEDFMVLPVIYDVADGVFHRVTSLFETFGLRVELPVPRPIAYEARLSQRAHEILGLLHGVYRNASERKVVCTHFDARSSGYDYPHAARLIWLLVERGFHVISFSPTGLHSNQVTEVNISNITISDSIELLRNLKKHLPVLCMLSVNSLMWPISAALDIRNLGLHTFLDPSIHQYLYPNIFVVTQHIYERISPCRLFLASVGDYELRSTARNPTIFTDYSPEFVMNCLEAMLDYDSLSFKPMMAQ